MYEIERGNPATSAELCPSVFGEGFTCFHENLVELVHVLPAEVIHIVLVLIISVSLSRCQLVHRV